jgi:tRNA-intron endonuclease
VKGTLEGRTVRLGEEGLSLYEQGGYGRPEREGLRLDPHEALYLVHRQKVEVSGQSFDTLLSLFSRETGFLRAYLVYRDLRERGYAVQSGPQDFRVYRRGERPGTGESRYLVRVLSERDLIRFEGVREEVTTSSRMRKQFIHAVVDDEDEITYYEVRTLDLPVEKGFPPLTPFEAVRVGTGALVRSPPSSLREQWYGKSLDPERILLSAVETQYLVTRGSCSLRSAGESMTAEAFFALASKGDAEFGEKARVYADLRTLGYIPKTGYKFGHHFRVYREGKTHSEMLVQAIPVGGAVPMNLIARSVRLSHSVKKKMLFACLATESTQYIEFGRIKL